MPAGEFLLRVALSPLLLLANLARDLWAMGRQAVAPGSGPGGRGR